MDKFEKEILRKINEKNTHLVNGVCKPYKRVIDVKPRIETNMVSDLIRFDVLVEAYTTNDVMYCVAYEFWAESDVERWHMMYNGEAEYNVKTKCFDMNDICYGSFTREMSREWLKSVAFKINFNGGN